MSLLEDLQSRTKAIALVFEFYLDSGTRYFFSGRGKLEIDGNVYLGLSNISLAAAIRQSLETREIESSLSFRSDESDFVLLARNENFQNRLCEIWIASLEQDTFQFRFRERFIFGILTNIDTDTDANGITCQIEIDGPTKFLRGLVDQHYTTSDQKRRNFKDTFFNFVTASRTNPPPWGEKKA